MNHNSQSSPPVYIVNRETSGWATASLVFGILDLLGLAACGGFLVAIICGHIALSKIKHSNGTLGGRGQAIAGLILGYFSFAIIAAIALFFLYAGTALTVAPKLERDRIEKQRVNNAEQNRIEVPIETLESYAGKYQYNHSGKNYIIEVSVVDGNLKTASPTNECTLLPQSETEFSPVQCADAFTGKIIFERNEQNTETEMIIRYPIGGEVLCPRIE